MKPCDCRSLQDCDKIEEQAVAFNHRQIGVDSTGVLLAIDPHFRCKFSHKTFVRLAKWYFTDQDEGKN